MAFAEAVWIGIGSGRSAFCWKIALRTSEMQLQLSRAPTAAQPSSSDRSVVLRKKEAENFAELTFAPSFSPSVVLLAAHFAMAKFSSKTNNGRARVLSSVNGERPRPPPKAKDRRRQKEGRPLVFPRQPLPGGLFLTFLAAAALLINHFLQPTNAMEIMAVSFRFYCLLIQVDSCKSVSW